jgi:hypothetical protein
MAGTTANARSFYVGVERLVNNSICGEWKRARVVAIRLGVDRIIVKLSYRRAIASAQWFPLTMALSRLGGHPVSVQAPATSKLAIGLRWMGRCNLVPGLSERIVPEIVRR